MVVGAGIVGATAAWQLARRGVRVDLVESGETGRATSAGAGIVQPWRPAATGSWAAYSDLAGFTYPQLAAELAVDSGRDPSYATVGGLTVSRDLSGLRAMAEDLEAARTMRGWAGLGEVDVLTPGEARTEWEREQWDRCDAAALERLADATAHVDVGDYLAKVSVPTLVLAPTRSNLTDLSDQFKLRTTIPDAQIEVFEGRGHNIYLDEPRRCTRRVQRFLQQLDAS